MSTQGNFLTEIANAIRTQEGSTAKIPAKDFAQRIYDLPQGIQGSWTAPTCTTQEEYFKAIANAIRAKEGSSATISAKDFANRILALKVQEKLIYYGTAPSLGTARTNLEATSVGNYALFAGGGTSNKTVDAYNSALTRSTPTALSSGRHNFAATSVGDYALFAGGATGSAGSRISNVNAYNTSLTRSTPTALSSGRHFLEATSVGNYALFAGGTYTNSTGSTRYYSNVVDSYNTSLTRDTPAALSSGRYDLAAASVGNYALFAGGATSSSKSSKVDAYNTSLTHNTPTTLSVARMSLAATSVGNYALFAGGRSGSSSVANSTVNAYNTSLTLSTPSSISKARYDFAATTLENYAIFGGGRTASSNTATNFTNIVDAYDELLTRTTPTPLSQVRENPAATTVGNYALFAGGINYSATSSVVDVYTIQK